MKINIKKLDEKAIIPNYAKYGDAGLDLTSIKREYDRGNDCEIHHTGLAIEIPEGYVGLIFPRSSNRKTDVYMTNSVGVIDSGYRGEILVCFKDRDDQCILSDCSLDHPFGYEEGDRIAQLIIIPYPQIEFNIVNELNKTERGEGGYGSTGR